ncbi:unnamed protein product [Ranitomeya imitator]|uniref:RNA helicase aquarius N-terminal domain-containing protein n=1 Tax=Ranitomeya imitator TaxID=111125 RepID=A0ABN9KZV7_9NEOB|nr:unnamed protein product [Ranitomeya imitator]
MKQQEGSNHKKIKGAGSGPATPNGPDCRKPPLRTFKKKPEYFPSFFKCILEASVAEESENDFSLHERTILLLFLDHCFNSLSGLASFGCAAPLSSVLSGIVGMCSSSPLWSGIVGCAAPGHDGHMNLEVDLIRGQIQQLISLPMWICLQPARLEQELKKSPKLKKFWNLIKKTDAKMDDKAREVSASRSRSPGTCADQDSEAESDGPLDLELPGYQSTIDSLIEAVNQSLQVDEEPATSNTDNSVSFKRTKRPHRVFANHPEFQGIVQRHRERPDKRFAEPPRREKFLRHLIQKFLSVLQSIPETGPVSVEKIHYCERFIELIIDLEALLPTRRWFNTVLDDSHLVVHCYLSSLSKREQEGHLFSQLLDMLKFYTGFEINDQTGNALTENEMTTIHYDRITSLQRAAFAHFPELYSFALRNVAAVDTRESLVKCFGALRRTFWSDVSSQSDSDSDADQASATQDMVDSLISTIIQTLELKEEEAASQDISVSFQTDEASF